MRAADAFMRGTFVSTFGTQTFSHMLALSSSAALRCVPCVPTDLVSYVSGSTFLMTLQGITRSGSGYSPADIFFRPVDIFLKIKNKVVVMYVRVAAL